jgi:hypothetical protein
MLVRAVSSSISLRLSTRLNIFSGQESSIAVRLRAGAFSSQSHRAAICLSLSV